jgi:parallel beta-helix repeat protein
MYAPGSFGAATSGNITKIYFKPGTTATTTTFTNFTIKIGHTSQTTLTTTWVTGLQTCYYSASQVLNSLSTGVWFPITLQTPFNFNASQYLVIEISQTAYTTGITVQQNTTTGYNGRAWGGVAAATASGAGTNQLITGIDVAPALKNDAGITVINAPVSPMVPGSANVTATLKNYGKDTLKSVDLRWSVNGTTQTSPSPWTGTLLANTTTGPITFGSYNFTSGIYTIKSWTANPNSVLDSNANNDTARYTLYSCNPANGTYVIDPSGGGNFRTFNQALDWLKNCGISGPVTFRVKPGTYTEQVTIPAITGSSATNLITFESYTLDSSSVNLTFAATGTTDNWTLRFNGCNYVTFRKMTISATGASYGRVVEYISGSSYDNLENNVLQTLITTSSNYSVIYSSSTVEQYNTIKNNVIIGGYYGVYWYGLSTTSEIGNIIDANIIRDFYYYGIISNYQTSIKIRKNTIITSATTGSTYGINASYLINDFEISQNNLQLNASSTINGLYLSNCTGTTSLRGIISNNFVSTLGTSVGTIYGIYFNINSYIDLNFNSVSISNTTTTSYAFYITGGTASTVNAQCNNFVNLGGGYSIYAASATTALATSNYNNLYSTGTVLGYWAANTTDIAAWRTASAKDANSVSLNPYYFTSTDLHVNTPGINGMGVSISGFSIDIDGDARQNPPDIGADEFNLITDDAGITAMTNPVAPCPGINSISVKVKNFGTNTLSSVVVGWSVNGVTQSPYSASLSLTQNQEATVNIGTFNFNSTTTYNLKFWALQPNGVADGNNRNDTFLYKNLNTLMGGVYTIGGTTANFPTIAAAITAMQTKSICSPITFYINKGTYTGRIVIPVIPGASAVNRITFNGRNADSVIITYAGTSSALATVLFNGADYITFKNVTIQNTATSYAYAACWIGGADYTTIDSCKLLVDQTGTASTVAIAVATATETSVSSYGNTANYTTISNSILKGGYYGIKFNGTSYTVQCTNNSIINCTLDKVYYYGIYFYYQTFPTYQNNTISGFRNTTAYGIMNYYSVSTPSIINNRVYNVSYGIYNYGYSSTPCFNPQIIGNTVRASIYGLYHYYQNSSNIERNDFVGGLYAMLTNYDVTPSPDSTIIANNIARQGGNASYPYGNALYLGYSSRVSVYHNTFQTDSVYTSPTSYGTGFVRYNTGAIKIKNNIFKSVGNIPCFNTDGQNLAAGELDYNIYYTVVSGNIIAYWGSTTYTSFTVWKSSMPTINKNSLNVDPILISKYNLHLKSGATFNGGIPLGITKDVDNDDRCLPMPSIGADEFVHPYDKPNADFLADTSTCIGSPFTFLNKAGLLEPKRHFWYVNNVFKSNAVNFTYKFQSTGMNSVTLITQNCSTTDTVTKFLNVKTATTTPTSYFVVNKNKIEVNEQINLTDLSSSCPEHWKWTIQPDSFFDPLVGKNVCTYIMAPGADTTQAPQIAFVYSGVYSVCLTTSNVLGAGTSFCMNKYIEVVPAVKLCSSPFETKEFSGIIYDDGGNTGQYGPNKNCGLLIHPCTKAVSLVFSTFDIVAGDFIRIYDGTSNKATPLWNPVLYPDGMNNNNRPPSNTDTFTAKSGSMYIEISTDGASAGNGIIARWFSTPSSYPPTSASFQISDTICNGVPIVYSNTSTGVQNDYFWDFENDGITDASTFNGVKKYLQDGYYDVKLTAKGCGGNDSFFKKVYVNTFLATPVFELLATNTKPNAYYELVTISLNTLENCVDTTIWDITPKTYTLVSGDLKSSSSVTLKFDQTVCYDFTVIGKYHGYSDTMTYPCFIKPVVYCKPFAAHTSADIGISRVKFNTIDNASDIGTIDYTDYSNTISTDLEQGATYEITLDRITTSNPMSRNVWIDYNRNGEFENATELVAYENAAYTPSWTGSIKLSKKLDLGITRMRIGTSLGTSPNTPCGPNIYGEYEDYRLNIVRDKTKPVMSLIGPNVIHIQECTSGFIDPGVAVTDNSDSNIADSVKITGTVDPRKSGSYVIYYNVKDAAGNAATTLTRTVIVDKEPNPPQISLKGNSTEVIQIFTTYIDAGYIAIDTCSGMDKVVATNGVDTANIGTYYYSYRAFDINGNYADISRTVYVMDTIDPVITSISDDTINLNIYNVLPNPLYTATDNYYSSFSLKITIKGTYYQQFPNGEATIPGFYTFMYVATDGSGNSDSISFVIHVLDKVKPELQLLGKLYFNICRYETITDPGYTVKDNYDPNPNVVKSGTYITDYLVNKGTGKFELLYTATDNSGNRTVASRFIFVSDSGSCFNSINPVEKTDQVTLYPNPGNGQINLLFNIVNDQKIQVEIYNTLGNLISGTRISVSPGDIRSFDYHDMKPGMYFVRVVNGKSTSIFKYNLVK